MSMNAEDFKNLKKALFVINSQKKTIKKLQHEFDTTRGLWCIDRNPQGVDLEWIRENAFQLQGDS